MDWSERKDHLAWALGKMLLEHYSKERWLAGERDSRALVVTTVGRERLIGLLGGLA